MPKYQFECDRCGKGFTHENNLLQHKEVHIVPTNILDKPIPSAPNQPKERPLNNDKMYKHKNFQFQFTMSDIHNCNKCGKLFNNNDQLEEHMIEHRIVQEKTNEHISKQQTSVVCGCRFPCVPKMGQKVEALVATEDRQVSKDTPQVQETRQWCCPFCSGTSG